VLTRRVSHWLVYTVSRQSQKLQVFASVGVGDSSKYWLGSIAARESQARPLVWPIFSLPTIPSSLTMVAMTDHHCCKARHLIENS